MVPSTIDGAIDFSFWLRGVRFRVEGVSARTGAILIQDRNLLRRGGQWSTAILAVGKPGILPGVEICDSKGETPVDRTRKMRVLHNPFPQQLVLTR
jgi:hypothetical protein